MQARPYLRPSASAGLAQAGHLLGKSLVNLTLQVKAVARQAAAVGRSVLVGRRHNFARRAAPEQWPSLF
jgi:hypothetical protein